MRQFIICSFLFLGSAVIASNIQIQSDINGKEPFGFLEDIVNGTIEGIRADIPEPIVIENLTIAIPDGIDILSGSADLTDLQLTGLKSFQMTELAVTGLTSLNFTLVLPKINLNTNYWGDLTLLKLVPLYGSGQANFHFVDIEIKGAAAADFINGLSIKDLRVQLYLGSSTFDIHGALDNEDFSAILSQLLNDVVTSFIDDHQEVISNIISPIIEGVINAILAGAPTTTAVSNDPTTTAS